MNIEATNNTVSIEAEQAVLGSMMADPEAIDRCFFLEAAHFYRADHRVIYNEIMRQHMSNMMLDPLTIAERVGDKVQDGPMYLMQLRASHPSAARIRAHADIVVEKAKRRALLALASEIQESALGIIEVQDIADGAVGRIEALVRSRTMQDPQRMASMMTEYVGVLEKRHSGEIHPIATGFEDLDHKLDGGFDPGTLVIIAGRPSMGKTALGLCIGGNNADAGGCALFESMEMPREQVIDRRVSAMAQVPMNWLRKPDIDTSGWDGVTRAIQMINNIDLYIDDQAGLNMMAIRAKARKVKRTAGRLDMLVIDQLSFIQGSKLERRNEQISEYTRALLALAKELGCVVVLLCQLSRKCEDRPNKRPMLSDLAESGAIEQDADTIIFLYRDEIYNPDSPDKGTAEAIIAKKRNGKPGMARLAYIGEQTRFANLAKTYMPAPRTPPSKVFGGLD